MVVSFWSGDYDRLCATTNSFDSESAHGVLCASNICQIWHSIRKQGRQPRLWLDDPCIVEDWNTLGWKINEYLVTETSLGKRCSVSYSLDSLLIFPLSLDDERFPDHYVLCKHVAVPALSPLHEFKRLADMLLRGIGVKWMTTGDACVQNTQKGTLIHLKNLKRSEDDVQKPLWMNLGVTCE